MKAFYRIKRDGLGLWVKMYTDCKFPWYAASRLIENRQEAREAFADFVREIRQIKHARL